MALDFTGAGSDLVHVSGSATLAGTLSLNRLTGILPSVGQVLPLATYASHTGSFGFVVPPRLSPDVAFVLDYGSTQLSLRFVPPVAQSWTGSSGPLSTPGNWSNNTTPGTSSSLSITNSTATPQTVSVTNSTTVHSITLTGTSAPVSLEVPQGIQLGVANQINVGANATLDSAGQTYGTIMVLSGGTMHLAGATVNGFVGSGGTIELSGTQPNQLLQGVSNLGQINVDPGSVVNFAQTLSGMGSLNIGAGGKVQFAAGAGRSHVASLTIAPGGSLDLADNPLDILYGANPDPVATINSYLASGYNHGAWNGTGIIDSAADANHGLGFAHVAPGDLLIAPALYGDANLDGVVNFTDLLALAQHYGQTNVTWEQGDFNYDGTIGFDDLLQLAQHYGQSLTATQLASLSPAFRADVERAFAAVPEPASLMWLAPVVGLTIRRRRLAVRGRF